MIAALSALALATTAPFPDAKPIVIGESYAFEVLDGERSVNVVLPPEYDEQPDKTWPVIFLLDGGEEQDLFLANGVEKWNRLWGRSRSAIIVGIETANRQSELLPETQVAGERAQYPEAGEDRREFLDWISDTVKPLILMTYRTDGTDLLVGESAAGHFVLETWFEGPDTFDGFAAISPSLQWNGQALARAMPDGIGARPPLYLSLADEGGETEAGMMLLLSKIGEGQPICFSDRRRDLHHANSLHGLLPEALQYLLPTEADWLDEAGLELRCDRGGPIEPRRQQ